MAALQAYQHLDSLTFNVLNRKFFTCFLLSQAGCICPMLYYFTILSLLETKTLSAALCCYLVMGKRQSLIQILSLVLLLLSALIMEGLIPFEKLVFWKSVDSHASSASHFDWNSTHWSNGVAPILLASFISGLSGALSQKNLQSSGGGRNPYLFS